MITTIESTDKDNNEVIVHCRTQEEFNAYVRIATDVMASTISDNLVTAIVELPRLTIKAIGKEVIVYAKG